MYQIKSQIFISLFAFFAASFLPIYSQESQENMLHHRFGAGASYAGGDEIFENSVLLTGLYEYRVSRWFGVEANFGMFQSNYIAGAIKFNPVNTMQFAPIYNVRHITSLDITANFSPFGSPWNHLQISLGAGIRRYTGFRNILKGIAIVNGRPYSYTQNFYHDGLEPYVTGRLNYDIPLSEHLSLGIRLGINIIRTFNASWVGNKSYPPNDRPIDIPEASWNNGFSHLGCNVKISL
jgi:hypothetical protein